MNITELITIDFLKVRFKSNSMTYNQLTTLRSNKQIRINNNILIVVNGGVSDSNYKNSDALYYNQIYIGSIITKNRHNPKDKGIIIQFENSLFYSNIWYDYYNLITTEMQLVKLNISRIDVAKDIVNANLLSMINEATQNRRNKLRLKTTFKRFEPTYYNVNNLDVLNELQLGNSSSSIYLKIYNKSDELKKSKKGYIKTWWMENGLMPISKIERMELRLMKEATKQIDINQLTEIDYLHSIFKGEVQKRFTILKEQKRGNKTKQIDVTPIKYLTALKQSYLHNKQQKKITDEIAEKTIKSTIKTMYIIQYYTTNKEAKEVHKKSLDSIVNEYSLQSFYHNNKKKWINN